MDSSPAPSERKPASKSQKRTKGGVQEIITHSPSATNIPEELQKSSSIDSIVIPAVESVATGAPKKQKILRAYLCRNHPIPSGLSGASVIVAPSEDDATHMLLQHLTSFELPSPSSALFFTELDCHQRGVIFCSRYRPPPNLPEIPRFRDPEPLTIYVCTDHQDHGIMGPPVTYVIASNPTEAVQMLDRFLKAYGFKTYDECPYTLEAVPTGEERVFFRYC